MPTSYRLLLSLSSGQEWPYMSTVSRTCCSSTNSKNSGNLLFSCNLLPSKWPIMMLWCVQYYFIKGIYMVVCYNLVGMMLRKERQWGGKNSISPQKKSAQAQLFLTSAGTDESWCVSYIVSLPLTKHYCTHY